MATKGLQRLVRRDVLARLKASDAVTALVAPSSIHGQDAGKEPAWPFIKTGPPQTLPMRGACFDGAMVNIGLHAFSRGRLGAGALVETAEDHTGRIGEAIEQTLDRALAVLPGIGRISYRITDAMLMVDGGEPGAFHYSCNVAARVMARREHA